MDQRVRGPEIDRQIRRHQTEHVAEHTLKNLARWRTGRISPGGGLNAASLTIQRRRPPEGVGNKGDRGVRAAFCAP
jgi:hypothetical protein